MWVPARVNFPRSMTELQRTRPFARTDGVVGEGNGEDGIVRLVSGGRFVASKVMLIVNVSSL